MKEILRWEYFQTLSQSKKRVDKYLFWHTRRKTRKSSKIIIGQLTSRKLTTTTTTTANFDDSSASFVFVLCYHLEASCVLHAWFYTRCTSVIISCAQPDSYWFITRRRQSWTSHSWFMSRDFFSVFSRVETTFVNRVSHRESRYLDLLIPSRQVMSFKCRAKNLSRAPELSKGHTSSREMIGEKKRKMIETSYTNSRQCVTQKRLNERWSR